MWTHCWRSSASSNPSRRHRRPSPAPLVEPSDDLAHALSKGTSPMARALRFHAVVSGKTLPLPDLSAFEGKRVEVIVLEEEVKVEPTAKRVERRFGTMSGQFVVP